MRFDAVPAAVLIVLAVGCGRAENEQEGFLEQAQAKATDSARHPGSPGGAALVPDTTAGYTVLVTLEDRRISVANPDAIPPGPAVLTVTNAGSAVHNLSIDGPGIRKAPPDNIAKGASVPIDVVLQPGTYTLYCPVLNHRELGEELQLIIRPPAAPPPTSTVVPGTSTTGTT
ncbi:MAG TPA: hypothetical protein VNL91_11620 [Thermoanaerobaculia bacterium]|nr:hypothetical protein [Thermoanaerobaculia bacterium]